jgi:hypothetical protein
MKTRHFMPLLTSAYLSAMLASSVAPIISDVMLAAPIDPTAAQKAFQFAVSGLAPEGFRGSSPVETIAPPSPVAQPSVTGIAADPPISDELLKRVIKYALDSKIETILNKDACVFPELCLGNTDIPVKQATSTQPNGKHFFVVLLKDAPRDIIISFKHDGIVDIFLTNKAGELRAAAINDASGLRIITQEAAAKKFKAELEFFASEAQDLPPTGTAIASNS